MKSCASWDCPNKVGDGVASAFCFTCLAQLATDKRDLMDDLEKVLRLEAEFVDYCQSHGLPNPHE